MTKITEGFSLIAEGFSSIGQGYFKFTSIPASIDYYLLRAGASKVIQLLSYSGKLGTFIPILNGNFSEVNKTKILNFFRQCGKPDLEKTSELNRNFIFSPIEYAHTSLILSSRRIYCALFNVINKVDRLKQTATEISKLAKKYYSDGSTIRYKTFEIDGLLPLLSENKKNLMALPRYELFTALGAEAIKLLIEHGARVWCVSYVLGHIFESTTIQVALTAATIYGWTIALTPNIRKEMVQFKPPLEKKPYSLNEKQIEQIEDLMRDKFSNIDEEELEKFKDDLQKLKVTTKEQPFSSLKMETTPLRTEEKKSPSIKKESSSIPDTKPARNRSGKTEARRARISKESDLEKQIESLKSEQKTLRFPSSDWLKKDIEICQAAIELGKTDPRYGMNMELDATKRYIESSLDLFKRTRASSKKIDTWLENQSQKLEDKIKQLDDKDEFKVQWQEVHTQIKQVQADRVGVVKPKPKLEQKKVVFNVKPTSNTVKEDSLPPAMEKAPAPKKSDSKKPQKTSGTPKPKKKTEPVLTAVLEMPPAKQKPKNSDDDSGTESVSDSE